MMIRVLMIDADLNNCKRIKYALQEQDDGMGAYYTLSVLEAIDRLVQESYQLVILDLSSMDSAEQTVQALSPGADDILKKSFDLEECLARAQNLLRRVSTEPGTGGPGYTLVSGRDLIINPLTHRAYQRGEPLALTRREFDLLSFLVSHGGQVLSRDQLPGSVWPNDAANFASEEAVRYQIRQLRKKLSSPTLGRGRAGEQEPPGGHPGRKTGQALTV